MTPPELDAFDDAPLMAVILEVRFEGANAEPEHVLDDVILFTEVAFVNEELYPAYECPD